MYVRILAIVLLMRRKQRRWFRTKLGSGAGPAESNNPGRWIGILPLQFGTSHYMPQDLKRSVKLNLVVSLVSLFWIIYEPGSSRPKNSVSEAFEHAL